MDEAFYKKLTSLSEVSKSQLSKILNFYPGVKDLVLEPTIIRPLERICGANWLKGNGVQKIFKLNSAPKYTENEQYFMIYTNIETFKFVVELIRGQFELDGRPQVKFHVICVPKALYEFEHLLEELGLYHSVVQLYSLQFQPIHIDRGILTLEVPHMYKNIFVQQDLSLMQLYSKSLWYLSFVVGRPKVILALGQHSCNAVKQLDMLYEDLGNTDKFDCDFSSLIIVDRSLDYPSALLTPSTYTALLKEIYDINSGICEHKCGGEDEKYDGKFNLVKTKNAIQISLDSKRDSVYRDIKNRYFAEVTSVLSTLAKQLRSEGEYSKEMALDEFKKYVQTQLQASSLKNKFISSHLNAAESIINTLGHRFEKQRDVEQCIMMNINKSSNYAYLRELLLENDKLISLRLLCLISVTQKLTHSELTNFLTRFYQEFGYEYGFLYGNLIKAGFASEAQETSLQSKIMKIPILSTNNFFANANKLKQIPADPSKIDVKSPTCPSYVFGGCYIPLVTHIASLLLSATPLKVIQSKLEPLGPLIMQNESAYPLVSRNILLYVVGGITYAEVAACNLLEVLTGSKITVLSDQIISGNDIPECRTEDMYMQLWDCPTESRQRLATLIVSSLLYKPKRLF